MRLLCCPSSPFAASSTIAATSIAVGASTAALATTTSERQRHANHNFHGGR